MGQLNNPFDETPPVSANIDLNAGILGAPMRWRFGWNCAAKEGRGGRQRGFPFDYAVAGKQKLWALALTLLANEYPWYLNVNGRKAVANDQVTGDRWAWIALGEFDFNAGANLLSIAQREPNARIKALRVGGADLSAPRDALPTVAGADYSQKADGKMASVAKLVGFGADAATMAPITAPSAHPTSAEQAAAARYRVQLPAGSRVAKLRFLPTSAINEERGLRAAARINGGAMQVLDSQTEEYTREWDDNVLRGYSQREINFEGSARSISRAARQAQTKLKLNFSIRVWY